MQYFALIIEYFVCRLGEATSLNGWFYLSKPFNKDDCTVKGNIKQQMHDSGDSKTPSIEDCIGHDKWNEQNDYCGKNDIVERPKGVICTGTLNKSYIIILTTTVIMFVYMCKL